MIRRREFLNLVIGTAVCALTPEALFAAEKSVAGWRFGVWELIDHNGIRYGQKYYWCRCDCGEEQAVGLNQLLSMDALSCSHVRHRGFVSINPEHLYCVCGEKRKFFFNGDGMRIWRCGNCEEADIRAYLRREYDSRSSVQFNVNLNLKNFETAANLE